MQINLDAAQEIARQMRLRDMGGIIVVDFINMYKTEYRRQVYQAMEGYVKEDRSKVEVLTLSKLCVMQITRQRIREAVNIITEETCLPCNGTGQISATILIVDTIEKNLPLALAKTRNLTLVLHPYVYAYFMQGWFSKRWQWCIKYKKYIKLEKDSSFGIGQYRFLDGSGNVIALDSSLKSV